MTRRSKEKQPEPGEVSHDDMDELKRDMRSAHLTAWAQENQQKIIAAVVALLLLIVGASLWKEHIATERASAATLYHQALNTSDTESKRALLQTLVKDYANNAYGGMAQMLLAKEDAEHADQHLIALLANSTVDKEMRWQVQLDLANVWLQKGDKVKAKEVLAKPVGRNYEQVRHYLMAEASENDTDRISHLEQSLTSVSHDKDLEKTIRKRLAILKGASASGVSSQ